MGFAALNPSYRIGGRREMVNICLSHPALSGVAEKPVAIVAIGRAKVAVDAGVWLVPVGALALDDEMLGPHRTPPAEHLDLRAGRRFPHFVVAKNATIFVIAAVAGLLARPALVLAVTSRVLVLRKG